MRAPAWAVKPAAAPTKPATPKNKSSKAAKPSSAPTTTPTTPATTTPPANSPGAKVTDYMAWSKNPGTAWQELWAVSRCDPASGQARVPAIANTMSITNPLSTTELAKELKDRLRLELDY